MLFVGGKFDGRRKFFKNPPERHVERERKFKSLEEFDRGQECIDEVIEAEMSIYTIRKIICPDATFHFYAEESLSDTQAIEMLIQNYRLEGSI